MPTLADVLAVHLESLLERSGGRIEIRRSELAAEFSCVPSQVNYVLHSRFTLERGYVVESRRGGGGYIRIARIRPEQIAPYLRGLSGPVEAVAQDEALALVRSLRRAGFLTARETAMLGALLDRDSLAVPLPERDRLRARLLRAALVVLARPHERGDRDAV